MKKSYEIEVIASVNEENLGELNFQYLDEDENFLGEIIVARNGVMSCHISDENYKAIIRAAASKIYGKKVVDGVSCEMEMLGENPDNWKRAKQFIEERGLEIRYSEDEYVEWITKEDLYGDKYENRDILGDFDEDKRHK